MYREGRTLQAGVQFVTVDNIEFPSLSIISNEMIIQKDLS